MQVGNGFYQTTDLIITFESEPNFPLAFESLDLQTSGIQLLAVVSDADGRTLATIRLPQEKIPVLLRKLEAYRDADPARPLADGEKRKQDNRKLVESISHIRQATLRQLWTDPADDYPAANTSITWEVWLRSEDPGEEKGPDTILREAANDFGYEAVSRTLYFVDRSVVLVRGTREQLAHGMTLLGIIAEVRKAKVTAAYYERLAAAHQHDHVAGLAARVIVAPDDAPVIAVLDTGCNRGHPLITDIVPDANLHTHTRAWGVNDTWPALNTLGVSTTDQIRLNETLYKALVVGGNATQSGREALIQFSQSLNSGVFRGQEFNSVSEQATEIIRILARETGKTQGELRKLANEGKLTADVLVNSLLNGSKDLDAAFGKMPQTVSQATAQFQSAFSIIIGQSAEATGSNRALAAAISDWTSLLGSDAGRGIIDHFSNSLKNVADWAGDAAREIKVMAAETAIAAERQQKAADRGFTWAKALESVWTISKMGIGFWVDQAKHAATGTFGMSVEEQKAIRAQAEAQAGWNTTTTRADAISAFDTNQAKRAIKFGSGTNEEDEKRRKRVIEQISKQLDLEKSRVAITQAQIGGNTSQVQVLTTEMEIRQRISDEMRKADPAKAAALENEIRLQDALAIKLRAVQEIQQRNRQFADDFAGTITSAFESAIRGGQSFSQTLKQLGLDIIDVITKAAVLDPLGKSIGKSLSGAMNGGGGFDIGNIFGLGGGDVGLGSWAPTISAFASGGIVDKPTGFAFSGGLGVAGEDGPEAILPLTRGPNGNLGVHASGFGGATVVNNWSVSIAGDATDATVARLQATMEQTIAARTPGIIDRAKMAVAREYKDDRNYLRR